MLYAILPALRRIERGSWLYLTPAEASRRAVRLAARHARPGIWHASTPPTRPPESRRVSSRLAAVTLGWSSWYTGTAVLRSCSVAWSASHGLHHSAPASWACGLLAGLPALLRGATQPTSARAASDLPQNRRGASCVASRT